MQSEAVKIKICGLTNLSDALLTQELGADYLGFIFAESSPRYIKNKLAQTIIENLDKNKVKTVGVFVGHSFEEIQEIINYCQLDFVQIYRDYEQKFLVPAIKVIRPKDKFDLILSNNDNRFENSQYFLFDTYCEKSHGGVGKIFDWDWLPENLLNIFVAGGVTPENIGELISYSPYGIDVCSGVEEKQGIKSKEKLEKLFEAVRSEQVRDEK